MEYTPRQLLEIKGAFFYIIAYSISFILSAIMQFIANAGFQAIFLNVIISSVNVFFAIIVFIKKKKGLKVKILPWFIGFTTTLMPISVKYNHAILDGWTFASQSTNTTAGLIVFVIFLSFYYRPKLFRFFALYAIFNWVFFLTIAYMNGAEIHFHSHIDGVGVKSGVIFWREAAFIVFISVAFYAIYRILSEVVRYDHKATKQYNHILQQSEAQNMISEIIREKTDILFQKIRSQNTLLNSFNSNMETQAARFTQISSTMEEIYSSSDQIAVESAPQLINGSIQVESVVEEFKDIRVETKQKLDETYNGIQSVASKSETANEHLKEVEKTVYAIKDQSSRIGQIVELIVDIADKINLLSLNASIEAARAGESGRGFAVVADEIGKLAFQTQESIKEINNVISSSTKSTVDGAAVIQETAYMMREMITQMNQNANKIQILHESLLIEDKFSQIIIDKMKDNIEIAKKVTTATGEQRIAFESTFKALEELVNTLDGMVMDANNMTKISNEIYGGATDLMTETKQIEVEKISNDEPGDEDLSE